MGQTNGTDTPFYDQTEQRKQNDEASRLKRNIDDFHSYHNIFTPDQLNELADDQSAEGREKVLELAEKYNIQYNEDTTSKEIVDKIVIAMDTQDAPNMYLGFE